MRDTDENQTAAGCNSHEIDADSRSVSRRQVLRTTAVAAVGGAGVVGATGTASARVFSGCDDWLEAPAEYPETDLTSSNPTTSNLEEGDDLVISVHGWLGLETSTDQAYTLEEAFAENDFDTQVVAASWDADTLNYWRAESESETAGQRLASWIESDWMNLEDRAVRLVGHSLGGRACLETLATLGDETSVDDVALVGAAVDDDSVCTDGEYAYGIATSADAVSNYHSENDDSVCYGYDIQSFSSGLGCGGSDCEGGLVTSDSGSTPENYTDVDVTEAVDDHCDYTKPDVGCVPEIVDEFE